MESNRQEAQLNNHLPLIYLEHTHNEYFREGDVDEQICEIPVIPSARFPIAAGISSSTLLPLYERNMLDSKPERFTRSRDLHLPYISE